MEAIRITVLSALLAVTLAVNMNTPPRDVTAHHGSTTTLTCDVEIGEDERDILEWSKLASNPDTGADEYIYVSLDNQMRPVSQASDPEKYTIEGHYDLVIHDVMFDDAGVYQCRLVLSRQQGTANVIVLGEPGISVNEDFQVGHTSNITCIAEYSAPPAGKLSATHAPSMRVFIEDLNPLVLAEEYVVLRTAYNEDIYILQQTFQYQSTVGDDGKTIVCEIATEDPVSSLTSEVEIMLHYGVHSIEIDPRKKMYDVGDVITCSGAGYPAPDYVWKAVDSPDVYTVTGSQLTVLTSMAGDNTWTCIVSNVVRGEVYAIEENITFVVDSPTIAPVKETQTQEISENNAYGGTIEAKSGSTAMIAVYVLVPLAAIVIVIIIVIVCKRSKRKNGHMYSPRKKDAEAANSHEKEQLQSEDTTTKTPVHETQNGNGKHAIENGGSKPYIFVRYAHEHELRNE